MLLHLRISKTWWLAWLVVPVFGAISAPAADVAADLDLAARVQQLEAETLHLRRQLEEIRQGPEADNRQRPLLPAPPVAWAMDAPATTTPSGTASAQAVSDQDDYYTLDELRAEMRKLAWTKGEFRIIPYGILWGNMVWETQRTNPGDYTLYVFPERPATNEQFHLDGRSTRVGLDITGPPVPVLGNASSGGKLEVDFQRNIDTENRSGLLLRHAYVEVKNDEFRLLAGQTWDLISPLLPGMLMYSVGWGGGNIGYRRAQLRGERYFELSEVTLITVQGSLNTNVVGLAEVGNTTCGFQGDQAGWPVIMGRIAAKLGPRGQGCYPIEVGVSSHVGEQVFDLKAPWPVQIGATRRTWSLNTDVRVPLGPRMGVQGELFMGENLGTFFGGILQGIDFDSAAFPGSTEPIRSRGGWIEMWYDLTPKLHTHVGYSIDDPIDEDIACGRTYNAFIFGNLSYDLTQRFLAGIEVSSWKTLWKRQPAGDSVHLDFVAKYSF